MSFTRKVGLKIEIPQPNLNFDERFSYFSMRSRVEHTLEEGIKRPLAYNEARDSFYDVTPFADTQVGNTNGSFIKISENSQFPEFIAISVPMGDKRQEVFVEMLLDVKVPLLVSLINVTVEASGKQKSFNAIAYLPQEHEQFKIKNYSINNLGQLTHEEYINEWRIKSDAFDLKTNLKEHKFIGFQVTNWEDHTPGDHEPILYLITQVYKSRKSSNSQAPTVVHCRGGIGRAGYFIACYAIAKIAIEENRFLSDEEIFNLAVRLRLQRHELGGNSQQYEALFKFRDYLKENDQRLHAART